VNLPFRQPDADSFHVWRERAFTFAINITFFSY